MKKLTITLSVKELVYDIQNKTFLTGRSRQNGNNFEQVANMQANDDDENANQVLRSIQNVVAILKTKLSEWLSSASDSASNTAVTDKADVVLVLNMPSNYNKATADAIAQGCHQYIVNSAVADWFLITDKTDAAEYTTLAANNITNIREALNKRERPVRPTAS